MIDCKISILMYVMSSINLTATHCRWPVELNIFIYSDNRRIEERRVIYIWLAL